jgi:ATP-dependent helicase/nuclease subunit B
LNQTDPLLKRDRAAVESRRLIASPGEICLQLELRIVKSELLPEIDAWLRDGGQVVAASERAARSLTLAYHRARRAEGLTAWPAPNIQDWQSFVRGAWNERCADGRLVLSLLQEQSIWARIVAAGGRGAALLDGPRHRLAGVAIEAHQMLCAYAPQLLNRRARSAWQQDAAEFSGWLTNFDEICRDGSLVSAARLPLELIDLVEKTSFAPAPVLLAGFDRMMPTQRKLFAAWSRTESLHEASLGSPATVVQFHESASEATELAACALWCGRQLAASPQARLLVVTQDVPRRRGEFERAFLRFAGAERNPGNAETQFEFSLGVPLGQIALARSAKLLLRWLSSPIEEHELDWLFSTGQVAASSEESRSLTAFMRALRRKGRQRTRWALSEFIRQSPGAKLPPAWVARLTQAQRRLLDSARRPQSPLQWAELTPQLLELGGWPGERSLGSVEHQVRERWWRVVEDCASLGFDGRLMNWTEFLDGLDRAVAETLFAPESQDAPILIAGPAESAGLSADAVWVLGANEDAWPARGTTHPFVPLAVQRVAGMPHASPQIDWDFAAAITRRLLASAPEVHFSCARQVDGLDTRPSRMVAQITGLPKPMPFETTAPVLVLVVPFEDASAVPFPLCAAPGGSSILTAQSQCAFKAFAMARLDAEDWDPAEAGLTAAERGTLLHAVLHAVWAGPPSGIRTHQELLEVINLESFVENHVCSALDEKMPARARDSMPQRYVELEAERLIKLVTEWLRYEQSRVPFTVAETEIDRGTAIAGLDLRLRLDRIDRLNDGSLLVIDYKSGDVSPREWELPRPDDVQLPLYAGFAIDGTMGDVGGLVYAKVRAGERIGFVGRVKDACATLRSDLGRATNLVKRPLKPGDLAAWRAEIERLAEDFLSGRAEVNPRDYPKTCEQCGLQALCRIQENRSQFEAEDDTEKAEAGDE